MKPTRVTDPQGQEWTVRRRWVHRRLRWRGDAHSSFELMRVLDIAEAGADIPVLGVILLAVALVLFAIGALIFIIPVLIFLLELLFVIVVVGSGLVWRVMFRRPWTVEACRDATGQTFEWKATGWRPSRELVGTVANQLQVTGIPTGGEPVR